MTAKETPGVFPVSSGRSDDQLTHIGLTVTGMLPKQTITFHNRRLSKTQRGYMIYMNGPVQNVQQGSNGPLSTRLRNTKRE